MASVTFPASVGGDGSTVTDDENPSTGLANGGHRARFVPALAQVVAVAQSAVSSATQAAASAATAQQSAGTSATSTSSVSIGTGSKSLTLAQTGKAFALGQWVSVISTAAPATQWMWGAITAINSGTGAMTVDVTLARGSGTLSSWGVTPAPPSPGKVALDDPSVITGPGTAAVAYGHYVCVYTPGATTITLPASPSPGDRVGIDNATGRFDLVVARNGNVIQGLAEDMTVDFLGFVELRFIDATRGWRLV